MLYKKKLFCLFLFFVSNSISLCYPAKLVIQSDQNHSYNTDDIIIEIPDLPTPKLSHQDSNASSYLFKNPENLSFAELSNIFLGFKFFDKVVKAFFDSRSTYLLDNTLWADKINPFWDINKSIYFRKNFDLNTIFYAQKLFIKDNTQIITITDIHGDIEVLDLLINDMIGKGYINENLKMAPNCFLIGLGDYMDRGDNPFHTLTLLLIIALKNPQNFILIRGNHEDLIMNDDYGINDKIAETFGDKKTPEVRDILTKIYDSLPVVTYVTQCSTTASSNKFIIFSHGLIDFYYNPTFFLNLDNEKFAQKDGTLFSEIQSDISEYTNQLPPGYGFLWNDLRLDNEKNFETDLITNRTNYSPAYLKGFCDKFYPDAIALVSGHDHIFAKKISEKMGLSKWEDFSPATGYVIYNKKNSYFMNIGLINNTKTLPLSDEISFIKFVSSPVCGLAYDPTYLVMDVKDNAWSCKAISVELTRKIITQKDTILNKQDKITNFNNTLTKQEPKD